MNMLKKATLPQLIGQLHRATGSVGGVSAPNFYKGWGGPVAGTAIKGLAVGIPSYLLTRWGIKATGQDRNWDAHRTALLSGILSGLGAASTDIGQAGYNFQNSPGGIRSGLRSMNRDPGTYAPKPEGAPGKVSIWAQNKLDADPAILAHPEIQQNYEHGGGFLNMTRGVMDAQREQRLINNMTKQNDFNDYSGSLRNPGASETRSGEGGNMQVPQTDPVTAILRGSNRKPKGNRKLFAGSDRMNNIEQDHSILGGPVVKEAVAKAMRYLNGVKISKRASDDNTSGYFADYDTFLPPGQQTSIPAHYTASQIDNDPWLSPQEKSRAINLIADAANNRPGLIGMHDITRAAVGAGIGYATGALFGKVLGGIFGGLAPQTQKRMQQAGTIAGLLINTGAIGGR